MKSKNILTLSIAFAACALLYLGSASAQNSTAADSVDPSVPTSVAQNEASQMVAADAILDNGIDAKKVQPGEQFRATLRDTVHLKNGTELPRDTVLVGTIATDQMREGGTSTLALRFTQAKLKDGKVVPIQAEIMGVTSQFDSDETWDFHHSPFDWNGTTLQIDQPLSGFDLHGSIGSPDSGVFVSTKKGAMKISSGSQLSLAIAAQG
ncbi:MAG: hypothetical protein ABSE36_19005 [Terracidiphilus sp.]